MESGECQKFEFSIDKILQLESSNNAGDKCGTKTISFSNSNEAVQNSFQNKYFLERDQSALFVLNHCREHTNLQDRLNIENALKMCFFQYDHFTFKDYQEYQYTYGGTPVFCSLTSDLENKRKGGQIRFTSFQTKKLEQYFSTSKYLAAEERKRLAEQIKLSGRQVKTWFQNRRAKWRRSFEYRRDTSPQIQTTTRKS